MSKMKRYISPVIELISLAFEGGYALSDAGFSGWEDGPATGGNSNDLGDF